MTTSQKAYILPVSLVALVLVLLFGWNKTQAQFQGINNPACSVTHATVSVGNQNSVQILAANSRRAYATVEQPANATNTLSLNLGNAAVANTGIVVPAATTSVLNYPYEFGLITKLPFVGAVNAITGTGSSTVLVTQCVY